MKNYLVPGILIALLLALLLLVTSVVSDIRRLHLSGIIMFPNSNNFYDLHSRPANISDVNLIAPWMTIGYINKSFGLSDVYLKQVLSISDISYPDITISRVAREQGRSLTEFVVVVKDAVTTYLNQNATTTQN